VSAKQRGVLWILASAGGYSLFTVFGKNVLEQLTASDVLIWRFLIAAPISWVIVALRWRLGKSGSPRDVPWLPPYLAGVSFGIMAWFAFAALDRLTGAIYIVLCYTYPAMVAVGAWLLGKPTSKRLWVAIVLTLVGVGFTVPEIEFGGDGRAVAGMVLTILNAFIYACYILYSERLMTTPSSDDSTPGRSNDGFVTAAWGMTGSLSFALVLAVASGGVQAPSGAKFVWSMIGLGVISTVVAATAFLLAVARLGPAPAALFASIEPAITLVWIVVFLGESLVPIQITGAVLVIAGVVWSQRARAGDRVSEPTREVLAP
jgi:drug/metabolite transporter (DMT)-like permease